MASKRQLEYLDELKRAEMQTVDLRDAILVSATYSGELKAAVLKFYSPDTKKIHLWYDDTGHKPYCFIKPEAVSEETLKELRGRPDVISIETAEKRDLLNDRDIKVYKVTATDPLAIGGSPTRRSIRDIATCWEADIKYYENYLYDTGLSTGGFYRIEGSKVIPVKYELPPVVRESLEKTRRGADNESKRSIGEWADILSQPLPDIRRVALDIEVVPVEENRVPDALEAAQEVVAVALVGSDGLREVLILRRKEVEEGKRSGGDDFKVEFFDDERYLLAAVFRRMIEYPFVVTFNGDDFDLNYLYHRAQRPEIGFRKEDVPITLGNNVAFVRPGVHLDLYKTFMNRSIQVYAFNNKYAEHTLNGVCKALLEEGKIPLEDSLKDLTLYQLAEYCYQDAKLTCRLTTFSDNLLMKLLLVISRIAKMPMDDVARLSVSNWIRSMMFFEHRRRNALIPRRNDLEEREQGAVSEPVIKGKKYKGGIVVEPKKGVYFNVSVLDFASLYPSLIKVYNLSYETVRCIHRECRVKAVPDTEHWVCTKRRGITSTVIGSLRDIRVDYYKPLSKQPLLKLEERALANVVSQALKVILNASYGVMGADIYPLYYLPAADATAALGRYAITRTIEKCGEFGIEVVYGDTDSLFLRSPSEDQVSGVTGWAEKDLGIELDLDKTYRYVAFSQRKKNYLGVLKDGSVDVKGLTGKKSHTPPFIRKAFYESVDILSRVKSEGDFERAREEIKKYLRGKYLALKSREIPIEELAFNVMMSKAPKAYTKTSPQHVKAAELLAKQGREMKAGDIIAFVKTMNSVGVKPVSMARPEDVDVRKYEEYMRSTFDQILDSLGYEFDEIIGATKIEDFFWSG